MAPAILCSSAADVAQGSAGKGEKHGRRDDACGEARPGTGRCPRAARSWARGSEWGQREAPGSHTRGGNLAESSSSLRLQRGGPEAAAPQSPTPRSQRRTSAFPRWGSPRDAPACCGLLQRRRPLLPRPRGAEVLVPSSRPSCGRGRRGVGPARPHWLCGRRGVGPARPHWLCGRGRGAGKTRSRRRCWAPPIPAARFAGSDRAGRGARVESARPDQQVSARPPTPPASRGEAMKGMKRARAGGARGSPCAGGAALLSRPRVPDAPLPARRPPAPRGLTPSGTPRIRLLRGRRRPYGPPAASAAELSRFSGRLRGDAQRPWPRNDPLPSRTRGPGRSARAAAAADGSPRASRQRRTWPRPLPGASGPFPWWCAVVIALVLRLSGLPGSSAPSWGRGTRTPPARFTRRDARVSLFTCRRRLQTQASSTRS